MKCKLQKNMLQFVQNDAEGAENRKFLEKYASHVKTLTENDKRRMKQLLTKLDVMAEKDLLTEDYREVLHFMLDHNCKLEQEALSGNIAASYCGGSSPITSL